jgi:proteasome accessory factor B
VPCANRPAFRSWVLGLLEHAVVLEPVEVRDEVVAWLEGFR